MSIVSVSLQHVAAFASLAFLSPSPFLVAGSEGLHQLSCLSLWVVSWSIPVHFRLNTIRFPISETWQDCIVMRFSTISRWTSVSNGLPTCGLQWCLTCGKAHRSNRDYVCVTHKLTVHAHFGILRSFPLFSVFCFFSYMLGSQEMHKDRVNPFRWKKRRNCFPMAICPYSLSTHAH